MEMKICGMILIGSTGIRWVCILPSHDSEGELMIDSVNGLINTYVRIADSHYFIAQ